jgi:hypothetical protein
MIKNLVHTLERREEIDHLDLFATFYLVEEISMNNFFDLTNPDILQPTVDEHLLQSFDSDNHLISGEGTFHSLHSSDDNNSQPYTTLDSFSQVHLHTKDGDDHRVGRVENQEFWAEPYDHTDYVGKLTSDWNILDAHGDNVGYVDNNCNVHKPNGEIIHEGANSALNAAAWMLFVGMGGKA